MRLQILALVLAPLFCVTTIAKAGHNQPENILFGTIWADDKSVASTNLVIEARRGDVGPVVARYRLGEDSGAGNHFVLRIQRETAPVISPVAVDAHEPLTLLVSVEGHPSFRTQVQLPLPGRCLRIDFGRNGDAVTPTVVDPVGHPVATIPVPAHRQQASPSELPNERLGGGDPVSDRTPLAHAVTQPRHPGPLPIAWAPANARFPRMLRHPVAPRPFPRRPLPFLAMHTPPHPRPPKFSPGSQLEAEKAELPTQTE